MQNPQAKRKILLTGATDGIGFETAKLLAKQGHYLLLHGRSEEKLAATERLLKRQFTNVELESCRADLAVFSDIRNLVTSICAKHSHLDVIINNAGVLKTAAPITAEGLDIRFMVNTIAPCFIANKLQHLLADNGRIVNVSSAAQAPVNLASLRGNETITEAFQAYAQSKLAIIMVTQALAACLKPQQVAVAVNPGSLLASKMVQQGFGVQGSSLSIGASILFNAALADEFALANGKYFDNDTKQFALPHHDATDSIKSEQVMKVVEALTERYF